MSIAKIRMFAGVTIAGASLALAGATSAVAVSPAAAAVTPPVLGHWAKAAAMPGLSALTSTSSTVSVVSCAPSADCAIGGTYDDKLGNPQAWVASGHAGTWANAIALPGSITTNGGHSEINGVSCAIGNYCVAVGETSTDQRPGDGGRRSQWDLAAGDDHSRPRRLRLAGAVGVVPFRG
jgi:hypothetical protein